MARLLQAIVDPSALQHNLQVIKKITNNRKVIAMIKANGYGHNMLTVANALWQADAFGVACIEEAVQLRRAAINQPIILMEGFFAYKELETITKLKLEIVLHNLEQLQMIENYKHRMSIWLKVETGMNRLGLNFYEFSQVHQKLSNMSNVELKGVMTHFPCADDIDSNKTELQILSFKQLLDIQQINLPISLANSAGILGWPHSHGDWVRPGIILYGVSPFKNKLATDFNLKPAMTLQTEIISIKNVKRGDTIGYGGKFTCPHDMKIGVIAIGYADGYPRATPIGTPVMVNQQITRIIGSVSMDMSTIDLTDVEQVNLFDKVVIWGKELPIEKVASHIGSIPYELLTSLGNRVYVHNHSEQQSILG